MQKEMRLCLISILLRAKQYGMANAEGNALEGRTKECRSAIDTFNNPPPAGRYVYGVAYTDSLNRLNVNDFYEWGSWQTCDSNTAKDMSAESTYFAKAIVAKENVHIGLIYLPF